MKRVSINSYILGIVLVLSIACNDKDEPLASITGQWQGDKAEFNVKPSGFPVGIPYTMDDFAAVLDFKTDGTVVITNGGLSSTGTYQLTGNKLILNTSFIVNDINLDGTYTIKALTKSTLKAFIEKEETVKDPNTGSDVSGTVKATLYFYR